MIFYFDFYRISALAAPPGESVTVFARCSADEVATGGGILSQAANQLNPGWQHFGSPASAPTTWQLDYFNFGPSPVIIRAFAECAQLVDAP